MRSQVMGERTSLLLIVLLLSSDTLPFGAEGGSRTGQAAEVQRRSLLQAPPTTPTPPAPEQPPPSLNLPPTSASPPPAPESQSPPSGPESPPPNSLPPSPLSLVPPPPTGVPQPPLPPPSNEGGPQPPSLINQGGTPSFPPQIPPPSFSPHQSPAPTGYGSLYIPSPPPTGKILGIIPNQGPLPQNSANSQTSQNSSATVQQDSPPPPPDTGTPGIDGSTLPAAPVTPSPTAPLSQVIAVDPLPPSAGLLPSPAGPPLECGIQPQCRLYVLNKLCCANEGILTSSQFTQTVILCTHPVHLPLSCLSVAGPANVSAFADFGTPTVGTTFRNIVSWVNATTPYYGNVTLDIESARADAGRPECGLDINPCVFNDTTVTAVAPVEPLTFAAIAPISFYENYLGFPPTNLDGLESYVWGDPETPGRCLEQPIQYLPPSFFNGSWPTYRGFATPCNATATYEALKAFNTAALGPSAATGVSSVPSRE